ncbi:6-phospho-3-hexuloisomerase [Streptococcus mitis]|uniref:3-hexulose-6-phosphate isomerase n=1 Tax=Streptococcus mitis TaxID=28037 RepID=A0A428E7S7_STRMT|nr:6-phospho-3-hexuloisomerase [Streptococcus mitis]RSJ06081.1 3-hexulose-6-phosphate isomerase [Streptococcus mitis]
MENYILKILNELLHNAEKISSEQLSIFLEEIKRAKHIFLSGAGRSGIVIQSFANRLMHLGFDVSIVGEISSPHSQPGDLLIICSGSGETDSLKFLAKKAVESGVKIGLVTMKLDSTIGNLASSSLILPGTTKNENNWNSKGFKQPMGSAFEQLAFLTFDSLILNLMDDTGETSETMFNRHADFE